MWSQLRVDMTDTSVKKVPLESELLELGGRSLIAQYAIKNIPPTCDPLGAEFVFIMCTSVFAGTSFTTAHRLSIGGKSPLTGGIKESSVGGNAATMMANQGLRLITVHGLPADDKLRLLHIDADGNAALLDGEEYRGLGNYDFVDAMHQRFGKQVGIASIGMAGERLYRASTIQVTENGTGHPSRAAARGGIGALMGSKGLKAVIIEKATTKFKPDYADEVRFQSAVKELNKVIAAGAKNDPFHNIGTISTIEATGANGILPVENFSGKLFPDYKKVGAQVFLENLAKRGGRNKVACQAGCVVQCSNVYNDEDGNYLTSGFEYETVALFGPNCRIADLDAIARMDRACDDIGLDTIDLADAVAVAMECGKIAWGDADATLALLEEVRQGTEFGNVMGNGCEATGKYLGCKRIPVVKHQSISGYDPRNTKGTGITYATCPQGADHTAALTMGRAFDDAGRTAQAYASNKLQVAICFSDSMMCLFAFSHSASRLDLLAEMMAGLYGGEADLTRITLGLGVKTLLTERAFNKAAGMTDADDKLPDFFLTERSDATGSAFDINPVEMEVLFDF